MSTRQPGPAFDTDAAINECLDLEAAGRPDELREAVLKGIAKDAEFEDKLQKARAVLGSLHEFPDAPNQAQAILTEVDYLRPFMAPRRRRPMSATRVAIAAAAVITLSFTAILQRMYPQAGPHAPSTGPSDGTVGASGSATGESLRSIASAIEDLREGAPRPAPVGRPHRWTGPLWTESGLGLGDTSRYDSGTNWSTALSLGPARPVGLISGPQEMAYGLELAQTGWTPTAADLSLSGIGLTNQPLASSLIPGLDPGAALLDLKGDSPLESVWWGKPVPRPFGPRAATPDKKDASHK
jgi:hypothetical protein